MKEILLLVENMISFSIFTYDFIQHTKLALNSVYVCLTSIVIISSVYYSVDAKIIYWCRTFAPNMCAYGGTYMSLVIMVTLCSALNTSLTRRDHFNTG